MHLLSLHGDHTPSATQTSGALLPAYGMSPSLECDPVHTSSLPLCGSDYGSVRGYGHSHAQCCVSSLVDPVHFPDSDHFEDEAAPADCCTYRTRGPLVRIVGQGK